MFVASSINTAISPHKQFGFLYKLPSTSDQTVIFHTRSPDSSGNFYDLEINGEVQIGGDAWKPATNFWIQYFRAYLNYFPKSVEEMVNLAIMDTGSNIFFQPALIVSSYG